jgi:hypothetical protein
MANLKRREYDPKNLGTRIIEFVVIVGKMRIFEVLGAKM